MWNAFKMDYELKIDAHDYRGVEGYRNQVKEFLKLFSLKGKVFISVDGKESVQVTTLDAVDELVKHAP